MNLLTSLYFGATGVKKNYRGQIRHVIEDGIKRLGTLPCLIGESGIPFDMNRRSSFMSGDYSKQTEALDAILSAFEMNRAGFTLWNYNPLNNHQYGDYWNKEDFSIYCSNEENVIPSEKKASSSRSSSSKSLEHLHLYHCYKGGRSLEAIIRPHPFKITGIPRKISFDLSTLIFILEYESSTQIWPNGIYTEIFIPWLHYVSIDFEVQITDGSYHYDVDRQTLYYKHDNLMRHHTLTILPHLHSSQVDRSSSYSLPSFSWLT
jgi:hypothetical protein